jgi:hypothetical protein
MATSEQLLNKLPNSYYLTSIKDNRNFNKEFFWNVFAPVSGAKTFYAEKIQAISGAKAG